MPMTVRERLMTTLRGGVADRIPTFNTIGRAMADYEGHAWE